MGETWPSRRTWVPGFDSRWTSLTRHDAPIGFKDPQPMRIRSARAVSRVPVRPPSIPSDSARRRAPGGRAGPTPCKSPGGTSVDQYRARLPFAGSQWLRYSLDSRGWCDPGNESKTSSDGSVPGSVPRASRGTSRPVKAAAESWDVQPASASKAWTTGDSRRRFRSRSQRLATVCGSSPRADPTST